VCITLGTLYKYSEVICIGRWIKSKYSSWAGHVLIVCMVEMRNPHKI
jgi:hypothetical protein